MRTIQSFAGANVYSHQPAVVLHLDSKDFSGRKSDEVINLKKRLLEIPINLAEHFCSSSEKDNFLECFERSTHFNHIIEHVALELMALAGIDSPRGRICSGTNKDLSKVIIETTEPEIVRYLLLFAAELVEAIVEGKTPNIDEAVAEARRIAIHSKIDANSRLIVEAAERRGIPWIRQNEHDLIQLGYGMNSRLVKSSLTDETNLISVETASDKNLTKQRLRKFSIPVPGGVLARSAEEAVEAFRKIGAPVVVKPLAGQNGKGVAPEVTDEEKVIGAFYEARKYSSEVLIEERLEGKNYRVLIVGGKIIAASERMPDGMTRDVTDETHRSVQVLCERAARVINLDVCEVNLIAEDISTLLAPKKLGIIEINAAPDLHSYAFPNEGKPRDAGGAIVEMLYPNGKESRIPIIAITGTNGKTSVTRMTAHILGGANLFVGITTTGGIYLGGELVAKGDMTGPNSARTILGDKAVEVAVLETARGGIVRRGLGYDSSDVTVFTNIAEDHIGQDGIESIKDLIRIKALVAERLRAGGTLVINADDENSLTVLERPSVKSIPKKIVYFSLDETNPRVLENLEQGETAYYLENDFIVEAAGRETFPLIKINEIPATLGGTAEFQVANAMASIAACRAVGISREQCAVALQSFRNDANNPGRNNLYKVGAGYVLVDYGHNTDGFAAVCRMAQRWTGKIVTGIIGLPGDRENRLVEEAARVAARGFDRVIVTEEVNRRGREIGEMAKLLCDAIKREKPDKDCEIIFDEIEAFSKAVAEIRENEVVVIFYRQFDLILEVLARNNAVPVSSFEETVSTS